MSRHSSSRNQRIRDWKVGDLLLICLLIAVCAWLLYQVKHWEDKRKALEDRNWNGSDGIEESIPDFLKFGRKDPQKSVVEIAVEYQSPAEKEGNEEADGAAEGESKHEEDGKEDGRGGGDDEIEKSDLESADEDGEGGDEFVDEQEKEKQLEDTASSDKQEEHEGADEKSHQEAREENYKADDASSAVVGDAQEVDQHYKSTEREENDDRTNVTGNASTDGQPQDVPIGGESQQLQNNISFNATLRNSTVLLEFEHGSTDVKEQMEHQDNSTLVEPNHPMEQLHNSTGPASDERMEPQSAGTGGSAATGDSPRENKTINLDTAQKQTRDLTEGNELSSENTLFEQTETSNTNGAGGEGQTASPAADENGHGTQGEPADSSNDAVGITEEERDVLTDLSTLPDTKVETRAVEDTAAE
uniref:Uncharacterized protein n=1 Tax=Anthurium amnicola TaxID=1678845 RepID=A0A1D1Y5W2_9ARAE